MRVLIGFERSGVIRRAFRALGHDAWSCDLEPADDGSPHHYQADIFTTLSHTKRWDLGIFHPVCTKLCNSGARWWKGQEAEQAAALDVVIRLMGLDIDQIAIENPPGKIGTAIRPADQYIQPWQFGHMETKKTGLWIKNLPLLKPTHNVYAEMMQLPLAQRSRVHWMPPGPERAKKRSESYAGIGAAMAEQWGQTVAAQLELEAA